MLNLVLLLSLISFFPQQSDHSDKPCLVTKVLTEGVYSDCQGWQAPKGEKMIMPSEVSKLLRVGDTFSFVWKETRWVAQTPTPQPVESLCTVYALQPSYVFLACKGAEDFRINRSEWPAEWYEPRIMQRYNALIFSGQVYPAVTLGPVETSDPIRTKTMKEQRRWRTPPLQPSRTN